MNCENDGVCDYVELVTSRTSQYLYVILDWCMCHGTLPFLHLKKWENDFFGVFRNFFSKIIFREISRYPWTFYPFIVTTRHP